MDFFHPVIAELSDKIEVFDLTSAEPPDRESLLRGIPVEGRLENVRFAQVQIRDLSVKILVSEIMNDRQRRKLPDLLSRLPIGGRIPRLPDMGCPPGHPPGSIRTLLEQVSPFPLLISRSDEQPCGTRPVFLLTPGGMIRFRISAFTVSSPGEYTTRILMRGCCPIPPGSTSRFINSNETFPQMRLRGNNIHSCRKGDAP